MNECKHCKRLLGNFEIVCSNCGAGCNYDPEHPNAGRDFGVFILVVLVSIIALVIFTNK